MSRAKGKREALEFDQNRTHKPKVPRPHLATEFLERDHAKSRPDAIPQDHVAREMCRHLYPHLQRRVLTVPTTNNPKGGA